MKYLPLLTLLAILTFCTLIGAMFKIQHYPYSNIFLWVGMIAQLLFICIAAPQILNNTRIGGAEKILCVFAMMFLAPIGPLLLVIRFRNRYAQG